ncbi:hypothetical protein HN031_09330 [Nocardioides sp. zg-1308]|uniref:hypothetical protein n=1 Tax=Nocardioides sp. zg-1308 TaxID=2736253 RepID=UPI001552D4F4|nr:hypothetical protein [Nocardioides sp. zg-1308]NPD04881.1 hypothetical protein [Nocardioides sp. zg-1308]
MRALALALALIVPALAACSGGDEDPSGAASAVAHEEDQALAEWRSAVEAELGSDSFDFASIQQDAAVDCLRTDSSAWTVELALSGDVATSGLTRVGLEHACGDVVPAFDEALAAVEAAADPLELVCGPDVELSAEDSLKAELVCAHR